jgi:hypothetical protein
MSRRHQRSVWLPREIRLHQSARAQSRTGWVRSSVRYLDVRIPQPDDKVVATLTVARYGVDVRELPPADSVYLVTHQENRWGIQASSTRYAIGGLL